MQHSSQDIHRSDELIFAVLLLLFIERRGLVFLEAVVALTDDSLDRREFARLLLNTHGEMWLLVSGLARIQVVLQNVKISNRIGLRQTELVAIFRLA